MSQATIDPRTRVPTQAQVASPPEPSPVQPGPSTPVQRVPEQTPPLPTSPYAGGQAPVYGVPQYVVTAQQPGKSNGLSVAALVCGIVGIVFAFIPVLGAPVGIVLGILATVMGAIGRRRALSKGMGTSGLVLGILSLVISLGWFVAPLLFTNH